MAASKRTADPSVGTTARRQERQDVSVADEHHDAAAAVDTPNAADSAVLEEPAVASSAVHPTALYVAGLVSPMSYVDQEWATWWMTKPLQGAAIVGYAVGWYFESFALTCYFVLAAAILAAVMCIPNWRQRGYYDPKADGSDGSDAMAFVDKELATVFYEKLNAVEKAKGGYWPMKH